jgi:hypothetical protein
MNKLLGERPFLRAAAWRENKKQQRSRSTVGASFARQFVALCLPGAGNQCTKPSPGV